MIPEISVLIPIYNGTRTLAATLDSWKNQHCDAPWELILVDNGSDDFSLDLADRHTARWSARDRARVHFFREDLPGQSAASNRAIQESRGQLLVFSAQDMLPEPGLLAGHERIHRERGASSDPFCVLGHIAYPPEQVLDPFMHCIVRETVFQFGFAAVGDPENANPRCLYAPNFSMVREQILDLGSFDQDFPYGWQDTDLGLRIAAAGGRIQYEKTLLALHDHPLDWRGFCRRMHSVGKDFPRFLIKHPGFESEAQIETNMQIHFHDARKLVSAAQKLVLIWENDPAISLPPLQLDEDTPAHDALSAAFVLLLKYHFYKGVYDGRLKLEQIKLPV